MAAVDAACSRTISTRNTLRNDVFRGVISAASNNPKVRAAGAAAVQRVALTLEHNMLFQPSALPMDPPGHMEATGALIPYFQSVGQFKATAVAIAQGRAALAGARAQEGGTLEAMASQLFAELGAPTCLS